MYEVFQMAVHELGGQNATSRALKKEGVSASQASIWKRLNKLQPAAIEWVLPLEKLTRIPRHRFRPDIYPLEDERGLRDTQ